MKKIDLDEADHYIKADKMYISCSSAVDYHCTLCILCGCIVDKTFVFIHRQFCNIQTRNPNA